MLCCQPGVGGIGQHAHGDDGGHHAVQTRPGQRHQHRPDKRGRADQQAHRVDGAKALVSREHADMPCGGHHEGHGSGQQPQRMQGFGLQRRAEPQNAAGQPGARGGQHRGQQQAEAAQVNHRRGDQGPCAGRIALGQALRHGAGEGPADAEVEQAGVTHQRPSQCEEAKTLQPQQADQQRHGQQGHHHGQGLAGQVPAGVTRHGAEAGLHRRGRVQWLRTWPKMRVRCAGGTACASACTKACCSAKACSALLSMLETRTNRPSATMPR